MVQPDGVQRGLVGDIIARFEKRGFKLVALKLVQATTEHLEKRDAYLITFPIIRLIFHEQTTPTSRESPSSLVLSNTWPLALLLPWSGKVLTL